MICSYVFRMTAFLTHTLGYPRIGAKRELKRALEAFWAGRVSETDLQETARALRARHSVAQRNAGIALIASNDFSFYDQILDHSALVGNLPARFAAADPLSAYFSAARGHSECCGSEGTACEMTKWFDTNYHYLVPEFSEETEFRLSATKPFDEFAEALALGIRTKPVLPGPLTYLSLGKSVSSRFDRLALLDRLLAVYEEILTRLSAQGAAWVQIDEPILGFDLARPWREAFLPAFQRLRAAAPRLRLLLATYFGELRENLPVAASLPVDALHLDLTRADGELDAVLSALPSRLSLSLGLVDGRNVWRNDFEKSLGLVSRARRILSPDRLLIAPSCSLLHVPYSVKTETALDPEIRDWLAFAEEKLTEVTALSRLADGTGDALAAYRNRVAVLSRRASPRIHQPAVKERLQSLSPADAQRRPAFAERQKLQRAALALPEFPTTTIGSFPQTPEIRERRARWKRDELSDADYEAFLKDETARCIRLQEEIGLDVLAHGEFERNDMVEYFGEQLAGFAFTAHGWVQSYGSRCVKPPLIYGDVSRPKPMTVAWSVFAQSLTTRPVKGMLTGPITILQWSFVRDDQPRRDTARQIALAIRDETRDLEAAGLRVIQIDEPALREGLPLRRADWDDYLQWAGEAFRLAASGVKPETQIHTHMCYCEFNDIIAAIAALDADVISLEASRSRMELLEAFAKFRYPNEVGPGLWDIHSPRVPDTQEMKDLLHKAAAVLPPENLWVNPDCGLKTRGWPETISALKNLVEAARQFRQEICER
jgi:5-methyltetrahydropteroyltriglutamate--homocysteine methyltransferase